jgi:membrane protein required for colicin V production
VSPIDVVVLAILGMALLRGLLRGAVREAFSLAALAAACIAVRWGAAPGGEWLERSAPVDLGGFGAQIAAGALIAMGSILVVALVGRTVRRGIRLAGLGMADRLAGGVLGATEGAIAAALLLMLAITAVGRDHPALADTRALEAFQQAEKLAEGQLPQVAAPAR